MKSEQLGAALQNAESRYNSDMGAANDKYEKEVSRMTYEVRDPISITLYLILTQNYRTKSRKMS